MRSLSFLALVALAGSSPAADLKDVDPNVFPTGSARAKELPGMMWADARRRTQEANLRESKAFAEVKTKAQWEAYRDARLAALRRSLGTFPDAPKDMRVRVTKEVAGDGFVIRNLVYETRPGFWATANLYLPAKPPAKMPGLLISHAHHTPKTHGELQDMGMTWARAGCAVLVPDHLGYGERRNHDFATDKDFDKPFRVSRQDYYYRYHSNLQLSAIGDSLIGWMVWDLMRGLDVLLKQPGIDPDRIILLGAVAGGGDPAGVTAALDPRVKCLVPFNFGGWQPESTATANPDRDFAWFGDGYWESTRGLKDGARDGFAHFVIVGGVAPRPVVYAHEFAWDAAKDPAWPRLQTIFGFYGAKDKLVPAFGKGSVKGPGGPDNTHCTHIGAVHRAGIYPALKAWFDMPVPEEYSKRVPVADLLCWTDAARAELKPKKLHEVAGELARARYTAWAKGNEGLKGEERAARQERAWAAMLGTIEPARDPKVTEGAAEDVPGGRLARFALEPEPGIVIPLILITPKDAKGPLPVVVMVAQGGKSGFLKERADVIAAFLKAGVAVCLPDVRGTGETRAGTGADRGSSRTSVSQTNLILGQPVLGAQLRDLLTVIRWLLVHQGIDGENVALWGDSFAPVNPADAKFAVPQDVSNPLALSEPNGGALAGLAGMFGGRAVVYTRGQLATPKLFESPYVYYPHEAIVPGLATVGGWPVSGRAFRRTAFVDGLNRLVEPKPETPLDGAAWVLKLLRK